MLTTSFTTDSIICVFYKKIEKISLRIKVIQKNYKQINNENLKIRLLKEYGELKISFFKTKSLVKLINHSSTDKLSISKLLEEKCSRCENEIFKNNYLFSA